MFFSESLEFCFLVSYEDMIHVTTLARINSCESVSIWASSVKTCEQLTCQHQEQESSKLSGGRRYPALDTPERICGVEVLCSGAPSSCWVLLEGLGCHRRLLVLCWSGSPGAAVAGAAGVDLAEVAADPSAAEALCEICLYAIDCWLLY